MTSDSDDLPEELEGELLRYLDKSPEELRSAVERMCAEHPTLERAIRRAAEAMLADEKATSNRVLGHDLEERPREIGPFHILSTIGSGGMGTVYLAEQRSPVSRRVALKVIKLGMDTRRVLGRFEIERQALAMMDHACIAKVFEAGATAQGKPYFAMEHVKGVPITRYCDSNKLSVEERLALFLQVCSGVQHAHHKGVVHRDLTPNNILVTVQDGKPLAKIIDFGLARATDQRLTEKTVFTEQGVIMGVPEYMSPEQAGRDGLDIDTRSDVYTLGVLLYELLTGALPFSSQQLRSGGYEEMCHVIRSADPDRPSTKITRAKGDKETAARLRRTVPSRLLRRLRGDLDWIVLKCLEKDRTRRYQSVTALADDIERHLADKPIDARPPSALYLLRKVSRRYRGPLLAASAVFTTVVAGAVVVVRLWREAERMAEIAEQQRGEAERQKQLVGAALERVRENAKLAENNRLVGQGAVLRAHAERKRAEEAEIEAALREKRVIEFAAEVTTGEVQTLLRQLAPVLDYRDLMALEKRLWPVEAATVSAWLARAEMVLGAVPTVQRARQELEGRSLPRTPQERERDRRAHPRAAEFAALQGRVDSLRRAQAVRQGNARPAAVPALPDADQALRADELNARAWDGVAPSPEERRRWGDEPWCVAWALAAVARIQARDPTLAREDALDTLMWAWFAVGCDQEAMAAGEQAVVAAPPHKKGLQKSSQQQLVRAIEASARVLAGAEAELAALDAELDVRRTWTFATEVDTALHALLRGQLDDIQPFVARDVPAVQRRLAWVHLEDRLARQHDESWARAREAVRRADGVSASKLYAAVPVDLRPLLGLVPIGKNPSSGLWEFYYPRSAANPDRIPCHRADGSLELDEDSGMVFVLVPGGTFEMGAQSETPEQPNYDQRAETAESRVHSVPLDPFLISRFELTQAQWVRLTGSNPSTYPDGSVPANVQPITGMNPVENVSWDDCALWLQRHDLNLPTEAQWEYACRAGTTTPWSSGAERESLAAHANLADQTAVSQPWACESWHDGHIVHAPVGSFAPNPFGLHDVHGNVWEWVQDRMWGYNEVARPGDGLRGDQATAGPRVYRGGGFSDPAYKVRSSNRDGFLPDFHGPLIGVRPARALRHP